MKMLPLFALAVSLTSATSLRAADPEGFALWKGEMIKSSGAELAGKIDKGGFAWKDLATYKNHLAGISHREKDGLGELHQTQADLLIVEEGEATLIVGGKLIAPKEVKPNEIRGTGIEGGESKKLTVGDVVHIPAGVPHQLKIATGTKFTYFVIKVDTN
jgi:mannose-6-phosphate isomerase-like protein (cupin superfamily)